jgi:hypothetical protein
MENINEKQKLFCKLYTSAGEFFGSGVHSYIKAYDIDVSKQGAYESAGTCASRLLKNVYILAYINKLLENEGLNDVFVDKQLLFLITQNADFSNKLGALKEYNKLKQRIIDRQETTAKIIQINVTQDQADGINSLLDDLN